jgi:hypothetical protein
LNESRNNDKGKEANDQEGFTKVSSKRKSGHKANIPKSTELASNSNNFQILAETKEEGTTT